MLLYVWGKGKQGEGDERMPILQLDADLPQLHLHMPSCQKHMPLQALRKEDRSTGQTSGGRPVRLPLH